MTVNNMNLSQKQSSAHGGVVKRFKMLTYYVYAPLFHRFAPCLNTNLILEIGS